MPDAVVNKLVIDIRYEGETYVIAREINTASTTAMKVKMLSQ